MPGTARAAELEEMITLNAGATFTQAADGTFWTLGQCGAACYDITHFSEAGSDLGDTVRINRNGVCMATLNGLEVVGNRAYVQDACGFAELLSYRVDGEGENPGQMLSDDSSDTRFGGGPREVGNGGGHLAVLGGASVNLITPGADGFYPQITMGVGVNSSDPPYGFEYCVLGGPSDTGCQRSGKVLPEPEVGSLNNTYDIAGSSDLLFVAENVGGEITVLALETINDVPAWRPQLDFGDSSQADIGAPLSVAYDPVQKHVFVSESTNQFPQRNRISEFNTSGVRLRSFGYGVSPGGGDGFETCVPEVPPGCDYGVTPSSNPNAYFGRLEFGPDGRLYAHQPLVNAGGINIQAIDVTDGPDPVVKAIDLAAKPLKVKKGEKTTLTATLSPCAKSLDDQALFQIKAGDGFDNIGRAKPVDGQCKATKRVKVLKRSAFRAVSIDSAQNTLDTSRTVKVKLK